MERDNDLVDRLSEGDGLADDSLTAVGGSEVVNNIFGVGLLLLLDRLLRWLFGVSRSASRSCKSAVGAPGTAGTASCWTECDALKEGKAEEAPGLSPFRSALDEAAA